MSSSDEDPSHKLSILLRCSQATRSCCTCRPGTPCMRGGRARQYMPVRLPGDMSASGVIKRYMKTLSYASNCSSKPKYETAAHESGPSVAGCLNGGSEDDYETANEDAPSSTISIRKKATKWKGCNLTQIVDNEDDSGRGSGA
jgi:hypothetical protein